MKKLIIDRTKWARKKQDGSKVNGPSQLLNKQGGMCCLGFDVASNGAKNEDMLMRGRPISVKDVRTPCSLRSEEDIVLSIRINDRIKTFSAPDFDASMTNAEQEDMIRQIFLRNDVEVEFIN